MKVLKDILFKVELLEVVGSTNVAVTNLCFDSRKATNGCLFVAQKGTKQDGHKYIAQAIEKGAITVLVQELPSKLPKDITFIKVRNCAQSLGIIASNYFDNPSNNLKIIAVTGTNGKTSIASLLHAFFQSIGKNLVLFQP